MISTIASMRWGMVLLLAPALAGCIPHGNERREPPRATAPLRTGQNQTSPLQCHIDLAREGVRFRALPDQDFGGGCTALNSVQLLDVGTPVTNLRAMTCPLARQFARWSREAVQTSADQWLRSPVVRIETMGTYSCRGATLRRRAALRACLAMPSTSRPSSSPTAAASPSRKDGMATTTGSAPS
jgi:hypothetical protein